ncbi:MAG: TonB family protein [Calditrichaeota bacterium]|nr:TonB family protein [Candidatus Cloacimonadota bacterium]MCA9787056.1 TonB family protein [Candidatus Cloacimonadota bacterium]MCB1046008.1 TonB family protein [Calditrichota bacterium]MCB9473110.1 TonB family protein [Candidatus Delongbacteria bacterium]
MEYHKRPEANVKLKYQVFSELGLAFALALFCVLFIVSKQVHVQVKLKDYVPDEIEVEQIDQTVQQKSEPRPARPSFTVAAADEDVVEDEEIDFNEDEDWTAAPPPPPPMDNSDDEVVDFFAIEQQPELVGGNEALYKLVRYPEMAQKAGVEGVAQIGFIVGADGIPREFTVLGERPKNLGFGQAAIDALSKMTFKPGRQRDRFVSVRMQQTIRFQLNN